MGYNFDYVGNELNMMVDGGKPMAAFCRATNENIDEFSGQDFGSLVKSGFVKKNIFYVKHNSYKLIYTVFTRPSEIWRFYVFKELKKNKSGIWSEDQELLESLLLGYRSFLKLY